MITGLVERVLITLPQAATDFRVVPVRMDVRTHKNGRAQNSGNNMTSGIFRPFNAARHTRCNDPPYSSAFNRP
jgi:hypothetical protein